MSDVRRMDGTLWAFVLLACAASAAAAADPYLVGDRIETFRLEDQHGVEHEFDESVAILLFSRDMDGGDVLKVALADAPDGFLARSQAAYVSDISGMPGLVARLFAVPSMRNRSYPMWLDREGETTARLPDVAGKATLIFCRDREITRIEHLATANEVRTALGLDASPSEPSE